MRLVREFAEALELLLKKDLKKQKEEIRTMYDRYVGPYAFYHTASMGDILDSLKRYPSEQLLKRMEMLAELYYAEGNMNIGPTRHELLRRAYIMYDLVAMRDKTYDLTRLSRMTRMRQELADDELQPTLRTV